MSKNNNYLQARPNLFREVMHSWKLQQSTNMYNSNYNSLFIIQNIIRKDEHFMVYFFGLSVLIHFGYFYFGKWSKWIEIVV